MKKVPNEELGRPELEAYRKMKKVPVVVVLDNVRSMQNVGSAFRTCDAFLIEKICLTGITARPPHRDIHKTALGATDSVSWEYHESTVDLIRELKSEGFSIISVEQTEPSTDLKEMEWDLETRYAVIFGNEVNGVMEEVVALSDNCVEIPQSGTKHSLNISVSIGIVLWEIFKQLK